ncbi:UDP-N-acetylmuramoyl-tripeptide--D-alanyl-D-alanine ligase [Lutibacter sp.]|uniref:UDP-N-acetylmuramoyl-tripeptide--D-alanyl-D- alanine ligase n=1 Tax=Lutibacter sp. TaxID=1925666 RepID=UPI0025BEAC56|nr:UDP-N-acetylmuramoyl-tripeptide--D-alanyl-D-alanine ligase [Lutibacter sp.]MCF6182015.1 UDP-N-acetylmuramoyl-tripeptide--D-alanyl-D-alanine ligase [Lutibacter sp.]
MEIEQLYNLYTQSFKVDTDTRKIRKGSIFFALKGENFNGNLFAEEALKKGASYAIVDEIIKSKNNHIIKVNNGLQTLQKLANYHRKKLAIPIISLTGSNGKTTTKELINTVLSTKYKTVATQGNLNNHIGVPLTLLSMTPKTEIGVVEMGANHIGEIKFLCSIAEPNYGYITNFGKAHLEGFGSFENIIKEKSELYKFIKKANGTVFINSDDNIQIKQAIGLKTVAFNQKKITLKSFNPYVNVNFKNITIKSNLIGTYNFTNIATAITIGDYFKVEPLTIKNAIENYIPTNNRSQIILKNTNEIILDAYNANPSSMEEALTNFSLLKSKNKIAILGDMFELGKTSLQEHQKIADLTTLFNFNKVYLIGKAFSTVTVKNASQFESFEAFKKSQNYINVNNTSILIKGSRGMALERILDLL